MPSFGYFGRIFPSFLRYKEVTGGRGQIEPGPPVHGHARKMFFDRQLLARKIWKYWNILEKNSEIHTMEFAVASLNVYPDYFQLSQ